MREQVRERVEGKETCSNRRVRDSQLSSDSGMFNSFQRKLETEAAVIYLVIRRKTALLFTDYEQFPSFTE